MQRQPDSGDELVEAVLTASRALMAVVVRSLAAVDEDVTLAQYRALVVLAQHGARRPAELADALSVTPSTSTRMCDRLEAKGLVERARPPGDRRAVAVSLSSSGRALVDDVTRRRRDDLRALLTAVPASRRSAVVGGLRSFAEAAGEVPDTAWAAVDPLAPERTP